MINSLETPFGIFFFFSFKDLYIHFEREREERAKRDRRRLQTKHKSYSERGFFHPEITIWAETKSWLLNHLHNPGTPSFAHFLINF